MAGTGAQKGNQYAAKERTGRTIGLYIKPDELELLEQSLAKQGKQIDEAMVNRYARQIFKNAVQNETKE